MHQTQDQVLKMLLEEWFDDLRNHLFHRKFQNRSNTLIHVQPGQVQYFLYTHVYNYVKHLQDVVGEGRALDVIGLKVESIANDYLIKIPKRF